MFKVTVSDYDDLSDELKQQGSPAESPFLIVEHDGRIIAFEGSYCEPEDNCFWRNYEWVPKLLVRIYDLGKIDAITGAINTFRGKVTGS